MDSIKPYLLTWSDMVTIVGKLKKGKSTNSFFKAEHLLYGSPKFVVHLHLLFNAMIQHGFVPTNFLRGTISPTIKDSNGDLNSAGNYRGITLCGTYSHLFEQALRLKFGHYLDSDELQFGFKPNHSTNHSVFSLKTCINYFNEPSSNVYVTFLEFSKAFDKVSHHGLFLKLMERKVPLCFLLIIIYWYMNMQYDCRWDKSKSEFFLVLCGTKQGGILSPDFFSLYVDDLIKILRSMKIGCHILQKFIAIILFADDTTLIAPTRGSMQQLLDVCAEYGRKYCLNFNAKKSKVMLFGKTFKSTDLIAPLHLGDDTVEFVSSMRYLGFHIQSDCSFKFSIAQDLCKFFGAVNSVMTVLTKPKEDVLMKLLYSNCIPILTYGAAVKLLSAREKHQLNVAINNAIRRIFSFRYWQSIRQIREFLCYDSVEVIFAKARRHFHNSLTNHSNGLLRFLSTLEVEVGC